MNSRIQNLLTAFALVLVVVGFGAVDDWFQTSTYGADGIAYIDNANAIRHGDWTTALNPYWSIGYPFLLAATRWMFPSDWSGEWLAVHVVNLLIFVGAYASFLYFIQQAIQYAARSAGTDEPVAGHRGLYIVGSLIFVEWQVQIRNVSQMTPDLLVSGIFFLLMAFALRFCLRPTAKSALLLGLIAGLGYVAKAALLPVALIVLFVVLLRVLTQSGPDRISVLKKLAWVAPAMALAALPYVIAISLTLGRFTLGESGKLNYAWNVNKLTHWHWSGGPAALGEPIHPVRLISTSPHAYEYAEPMHVTYPPFYNPFYWFEGYHRFFDLHNQMAAIKANLFVLSTIFFSTPHSPVKAVLAIALAIVAALVFTNRGVFAKRLGALWPVYVPPLLATAMYISVCLEARYVVGFLCVLLITPLLALFIPTPVVSKRVGCTILFLVSLISLTYLIKDAQPELGRALRNEPYTQKEDWRIAFYLQATGIAPGTKVAMVKVERGIQTTWAFVPGLHVVGQIGNQDLTDQQQQQDLARFVNSPDIQQNIFNFWRKAGAELVVALDLSEPPKGKGWTPVPGTKAWVHPL